MSNEVHDYLHSVAESQIKLRDDYIKIKGIQVRFKVPNAGTTFDEFGDVTNTSFDELNTHIIVKFEQLRAMFNSLATSAEDYVPITALAKTTDDIQKGSEVDLSYVTDAGEVTKTFVVNGVFTKAEDEGQISKMLSIVPKRR